MRHLFVMLLVGLLGFTTAIDHAEAKRFGGGKSFGSYSRSAQQPASPSRSTASTPPRQPSPGLSRFAGPLAGLLAGGLLASLFFGGAFDGFRMLDILLIAIALWIGMRLLTARRRQAHAGAQTRGDHQAEQNAGPMPFMSTSRGEQSQPMSTEPSWFNRDRFLAGAKEHFMTLQRAWDNNDLERIQEYVTPSLYNTLKAERAEQPPNNLTEIVRLFAELGSVQESGNEAEATVLFHGLLMENGEETEFNETWHLKRAMNNDAPWYVQGIEQNAT